MGFKFSNNNATKYHKGGWSGKRSVPFKTDQEELIENKNVNSFQLKLIFKSKRTCIDE